MPTINISNSGFCGYLGVSSSNQLRQPLAHDQREYDGLF